MTEPAAVADLTGQLHNIGMLIGVVRAGSIAKAGRAQFKATSAVTRSVNELERAIGTRLFERSPRGIVLNRHGELVVARGERIATEIALAAAEVARARGRAGDTPPRAVEHVLSSGRKLQLIVAVAETENVSEAATRLGLT